MLELLGLLTVLIGQTGAAVAAGTTLQAFDEAGAAQTIRIDAITPTDGLDLYSVSLRTADGDFVPYCLPDREGRLESVVLSGRWDASGTFRAGKEVTFACLNGALGKCVRWGYKPWARESGKSLAAFHQACTRMVRADYCGNGQHHTKDGTFIDVWDTLGVQKREKAMDREVVLEAGWGPDGATWLNVPRWSDDVSAVVAECPKKLAKRVAVEGKFLTDEQIRARFHETLLFNERSAKLEDGLKPPNQTPRGEEKH